MLKSVYHDLISIIFSKSSSASSAVFTRINMGIGLLSGTLGMAGLTTHIILMLFFPCRDSGTDSDNRMFNRMLPGMQTKDQYTVHLKNWFYAMPNKICARNHNQKNVHFQVTKQWYKKNFTNTSLQLGKKKAFLKLTPYICVVGSA